MTGIYGATKHALETVRYARSLFDVDVVVVEPGWLDSDFGGHRLAADIRVGAPYDAIVRRGRRSAEDSAPGPRSAAEVAAAIADAVEAAPVPLRWRPPDAAAMIEPGARALDDEYEQPGMGVLEGLDRPFQARRPDGRG